MAKKKAKKKTKGQKAKKREQCSPKCNCSHCQRERENETRLGAIADLWDVKMRAVEDWQVARSLAAEVERWGKALRIAISVSDSQTPKRVIRELDHYPEEIDKLTMEIRKRYSKKETQNG